MYTVCTSGSRAEAVHAMEELGKGGEGHQPWGLGVCHNSWQWHGADDAGGPHDGEPTLVYLVFRY